ncbi:MAG: DUF6428 family protein [Pseudomonadota bacterium]
MFDFNSLMRAVPDSDALVVPILGDAGLAPGFHITEVSRATLDSVDCGGRRTTRQEVRVQLLAGTGRALTARRFRQILGLTVDALPGIGALDVVFEAAPNGGAAALWTLTAVRAMAGGLHLDLAPRAPVCRPRLEDPDCCAPKVVERSAKASGVGADGGRPEARAYPCCGGAPTASTGCCPA